MRSVARPVRARRVLGFGAVSLALAITTACGGSALDPKEVRAANEAISGNSGGSGGAVVDPGTGPVVDPGSGEVVDPGAGGGGSGEGGNGGGGNGGGGTPGAPGGGAAPLPGVKAASCAGFKNGPGMTDKVIKIGNSSDISGPVPGLFEGAQTATKAYVAYFNRTSSICGRKLELTTLDSKTDAGADQQSYTKLCDSVFAAVGSMSAFDSGGASTADKCGLPDIRSASVTATRNNCSTCFAAQPTGNNEHSNAVPDYFVKNYKEASQKGAFLALSVGAAAENATAQKKVSEQRGMKFLYDARIDVAEFNYGPYVQAMKSKGVEWVQFLGAYQQSVRLAQAMQSADFKPQVLLYDPSVYDDNFLKTGGSAVEGAFMYINFTPLNESQPELNLYKQWLQQVSPGAKPTFFGAFSWSAAKMFVEKAQALGGKLTRASLVSSLKGISDWTGGGMHGPMDVGGKHNPSCIRFMRVKGGKFVPEGGTKYMCNGSSRAR